MYVHSFTVYVWSRDQMFTDVRNHSNEQMFTRCEQMFTRCEQMNSNVQLYNFDFGIVLPAKIVKRIE